MSDRLKLTLAFVAVASAVLLTAWLTKGLSFFLVGVSSGVLLCAFFPDLDGWVRGALGWLRRLAFGVRAGAPNAANIPIRARERYAKPAPRSDATRPTEALTWTSNALRAGSNILQFFAGLLSWILRHPVLAFGLVALVFVTVVANGVRLPFGGESREHAIVRADVAERISEHNREIGRASVEITDAFHAREASINRDLESAREAVESVPDDAAAIDVLRAWARADRSLLDGGNASG